MYHFIDRRTTSLDDGGRFLLWSMRRWVSAAQQQICPPAMLSDDFAKRGMSAALPHFHMAMMTMARDGLRTMYFAPLNCSAVGEDEALLLSIFAQMAAQKPDFLRDTAKLLVKEEMAAALARALAGVGVSLAVAGLLPATPVDLGVVHPTHPASNPIADDAV
jgi:hypothetical protein